MKERRRKTKVESYLVGRDEETFQAVRALYQLCFGQQRSVEAWQWRYLANPASAPVTLIARGDDGAIAGHQAITPVHLNVRGRPVLGGQSGDSMVDPGRRGGGVFEDLLLASHGEARERAMALIYGFPGPMSLPVFLQKAGWDRIVQLTDYRYDIDFAARARKLLRIRLLVSVATAIARAAAGFRIWVGKALVPNTGDAIYRTSEHVPEGYAAFWKAAARNEILSVWKDHAYMSWRYDGNPSHRYRYHWIEENGVIACLAVIRAGDDQWLVAEMMAANKSSPLNRALLWRILADALRAGASAVAFQGSDSGYFSRAFSMFRQAVDLDKVFALYPVTEASSVRGAELGQNWTVSLGDWDGV